MNLIDLINIRALKPQDLNFVIDSSVKSLSKYNKTIFKGWKHTDVCSYLEKVFLHALSTSNYSTFIACQNGDEDAILAYIIADTHSNHIFFQYTKYAYRKLGIQKLFLLPLVIDTNETITIQWAMKDAINMSKANKVSIINKNELNLIKELYQ